MSTAYRCDLCTVLYDEAQVSLIKTILWDRKSIEVTLQIKDQQTNTEYDVCSNCLEKIIKKMGEET